MEIEIDERNIEILSENVDDLNSVPRISCDKLTYNQFYYNFMLKNLPVVITGIKLKTEISSNWFENGKFNINSLLDALGDFNVPVANCSSKFFNSHEKIIMKFSEYIKYWNGDRKGGELYLKDFHLKQEFPSLDFYNLPSYFASDWLNEFLIDNDKDDYRFIYIGPKNTWTPFHSDVFGSYSWSANICGRKQWLLLPPGEEIKLKDELGNLPFTISTDLLEEKNVKYFDLVQNCNETLFVPSKWFHQVCNLEDTVSVNHNWFNACNIKIIIENVIQHFNEVEREISDCKEMENYEEHCQLMLKSSFGINFFDLLEILSHIMQKRINQVGCKNFTEFSLGKFLVRKDLETLLELFQDLKENILFTNFRSLLKSIEENFEKIKEVLN